ncbi:unnamed protein product [Kuraishia capsulata CBS 1993]|uniref:Uncharacterized protein n=1 Tax=Kuraishia capsulata CBS 1993 TaxID=1382522 RepID=W6MSQ4_9ASCO|nr:uncharacterized protein KUCA_T00005391001 [Kuraishia capsulata CBS 1993]CDK29403.1 unnamed protein product [Kuraishia capsulata CBS 1993]
MSHGYGNLPSLKAFWKQTLFLSCLAIGTAYFVKSKVHLRRRQQYVEESKEELPVETRPGFPTTQGAASSRKSEYEGSGSSYMSRKSGDKFSWGIFK